MELTIKQAMEHGVTAHNAGKLQEAAHVYQAILESQPKNPDANHNLGLIAISTNQIAAALTLFRNALDVNSRVEQFWFSYIDALVKNNQLKDAKQAIKKAKKKGINSKDLEAFLSQSKVTANNEAPSQALLNSLSEYYQNGQFSDAENLATSITQKYPTHPFSWKILGVVLKQTGKINESLTAMRKSVRLAPHDAEAHSNLSVTLQGLGNWEEAEASLKQAIALKPDHAEAHNNLGMTLQELGRLEEAEASYTQAIALQPHMAEAHSNLGVMLQELGRLDEAAVSYTRAIALKPDYAEAYSNLGNTLKELGRLEEAEASYRHAIALKPDYAEAHSNLGATLRELGRLKEAEESLRQAIALKRDFSLAYSNLGVVLYINGDIDSGLKNLEKANSIDPNLGDNQIMLSILRARKARGETKANADGFVSTGYESEQFKQPIILYRAIDTKLISSLHKIKSIELDKFDNSRFSDPRYGVGKCSRDFNLFKDDSPAIKSVADDLIIIMREAVKSDIYIEDSFFNILGAGGGTTPHTHLSKLDADKYLNFGKQKYSLVYYISVGDQNSKDPGILKLYDPSEDILPSDGMIAIFPAERKHSAIYSGKKDRVMIGVNFYSL